MPGESLSLKCPCGYIKHDVIHLGAWEDRDRRILNFCGGIWIVNKEGSGATCKKCGLRISQLEFFCAFCGRVTDIPVQYRVAASAGRAVVMQMSVHKTVVFSIGSDIHPIN